MAPFDRQGKAKATVEFGEKFDLSLDSEGYGCIHTNTTRVHAWLNRWNAIGSKQTIIRNVCWKIYRQGENRNYCTGQEIHLSGSILCRPRANTKNNKKQEHKAQMRLDNSDRIEVERTFRLSKCCYGMDCIATKLKFCVLFHLFKFAIWGQIREVALTNLCLIGRH